MFNNDYSFTGKVFSFLATTLMWIFVLPVMCGIAGLAIGSWITGIWKLFNSIW